MIHKIISKLTFLKKLNKKLAKPIFTSIIYLDDVFLKLRIFLISIFLKKDNKVKKALKDLKENGVAIIENYYSDDEINKIKKECLMILDQIPLEKAKNTEYIEAARVNIEDKTIYLEKLGKSIKIKGLNFLNSFFNKIGKKMELNLITLTYHLNTSKPYILYNVTHDGSATHPVLKDYSKVKTNEAIAGKPHVDLFIHKLRGFVALNDIDKENGATIYYNRSTNSKILKKYYTNLFLEEFDFKIDNKQSNYVDGSELNELSKKCPKLFLNCKKGDLGLIDLKTAHHGIIPKKGERHLLWFYY
ncbi:MAG: hypothetical protein CBC84_002560 [Pelagibacteraceae bacterium TMED124]|nr:MAG: hypothetical protein CBC84_002560 [Pelagibacteraceae bacterium TMED124]|tara:strand:- start:295 stop:1200 length:906 start_codon:yes stop_codon:yes gene_type:complete